MLVCNRDFLDTKQVKLRKTDLKFELGRFNGLL